MIKWVRMIINIYHLISFWSEQILFCGSYLPCLLFVIIVTWPSFLICFWLLRMTVSKLLFGQLTDGELSCAVCSSDFKLATLCISTGTIYLSQLRDVTKALPGKLPVQIKF